MLLRSCTQKDGDGVELVGAVQGGLGANRGPVHVALPTAKATSTMVPTHNMKGRTFDGGMLRNFFIISTNVKKTESVMHAMT